MARTHCPDSTGQVVSWRQRRTRSTQDCVERWPVLLPGNDCNTVISLGSRTLQNCEDQKLSNEYCQEQEVWIPFLLIRATERRCANMTRGCRIIVVRDLEMIPEYNPSGKLGEPDPFPTVDDEPPPNTANAIETISGAGFYGAKEEDEDEDEDERGRNTDKPVAAIPRAGPRPGHANIYPIEALSWCSSRYEPALPTSPILKRGIIRGEKGSSSASIFSMRVAKLGRLALRNKLTSSMILFKWARSTTSPTLAE